ncbi:hypothetical protein TNCV_168071 [Trichonephila clavipes]|nr:hypothetical protein TNCV_168071 [Trichonephila clavipes]
MLLFHGCVMDENEFRFIFPNENTPTIAFEAKPGFVWKEPSIDHTSSEHHVEMPTSNVPAYGYGWSPRIKTMLKKPSTHGLP